MLFLAVLLVPGIVVGAAPEPGADPDLRSLTPDRVIASLGQVLAWYRDARVAMRAQGAAFTREDQQTALGVVRRAFDTARAEAALLRHESALPAGHQASGPVADRSAEVRAAIESDQQELARLRARRRAVRGRRRQALDSEIAAASNRVELDRLRLEFLTKLEKLDAPASGGADLDHQIQALQLSVPELSSSGARSEARAPVPADVSGGTWALLQRALALQRAHGVLDQLARSTSRLVRGIDADLRLTRSSLEPVVARLRALTADPGGGGSLADGERAFQDQRARARLLGALILSLREESALAHRYATDLDAWQGAIDREARQALENLAIGLIGVAIAVAAILVGAVLSRVATVRYVQDPSRRRLILTARNVLAVTAVALVLVFHFASELTALVAGLGFAAAGIAFALQNVILAMAGYFSMVAPNGIRVGDRVSLQGPFGYVQGEVLEIGFVRIRLRELAEAPLRPTGRLVVFPNSVVFTGSFFKHPPTETPAKASPPIEPGAAA
jgi:hypothetical protein